MKKTIYACFEITSKCNLNCGFCWSLRNTPDLNLSQVKIVLIKLKEIGIRNLSIGGGEPLLRADLPQILSFIKKLKMRVGLSTNGLLLNRETIKKIKNKIDWLAIALDGSDVKTNTLMRGNRNHFSRVINFLDLLSKDRKYSDVKIKINTVATRINIDSIERMPDLLKRYRNIKKWKIFRFASRGAGLKHIQKYNLSNRKFLLLERKLSKKKFPFSILFSSEKLQAGSLPIIQSNGNVLIARRHKYICCGNLLENSAHEILTKVGIISAKNKNLFQKSYNFIN